MRRWFRILRYPFPWLPVSAGLAIAYLAIVNPLACLIHCARHEAQAHEMAADPRSHYVCLLATNHADPPAATADQPIPIRSHTLDADGLAPRAVYAGILMPAAAAIGLPGQPRIALPPLHATLQRHEAPPLPPPERAES